MKKIIVITCLLINVFTVFSQSKMNRPQEPQEPFPYITENVVFENISAGIKLAGTLSYPDKDSNFPAVVLITGSGPQNRNEELFGHKPFLVIADYLTQQGIAVLRYDDRGVGESEGDFSTATTKDFATDAKAAFDYLVTRSEVNPTKVGLLGHSEGGTITFMAATENKDIAFIVSLAGGAIKGDSLLYIQREMLSKASGVSDIVFQQNEAIVKKMSDIANNNTKEAVLQDMDKFVSELLPSYQRNNKESRTFMSAHLAGFVSPWMQFYLKYDPANDLKKIQCPVFALNGDMDLQVEAERNLDTIKKRVKGEVTVKKYIDLNHLFQYCATGFGLPSEYGQIEQTISPKVLEDISEWILKTTK